MQFQQVTLYLVACLESKPPLQRAKVTVDEVNRGATHTAYKVMVMTFGPCHHVSATPIGCVYTAHQPMTPEDIKCAIDRHPPDVGCNGPSLSQQGIRCNTLMTRCQRPEDGMALRSKSISILPQYAGDSICRESHRVSILRLEPNLAAFTTSTAFHRR
jgi:hypothetical protein